MLVVAKHIVATVGSLAQRHDRAETMRTWLEESDAPYAALFIQEHAQSIPKLDVAGRRIVTSEGLRDSHDRSPVPLQRRVMKRPALNMTSAADQCQEERSRTIPVSG